MPVIPGPRYVLIGFSGSPNSYAALNRAAAEAQKRHARLDVVRVIPATGGRLRTPAAWLRLRNDVARVLPRTQHLTTRLRIARGDVATELNRLARRADVLFLGARQTSAAANPLGGATVHALLSSSPCHVVICEGQSRQDA
ncbi:universal stress protein [Actinomadura alba]|uniref:Universal stress protein n=1 Tax=Actinomadura alba TaxID=406431 RepID=A0ABR7M1N9_9ACTN|nr:universal stress protein [Actinomadura alba]MBC6470503.1 universal stress protein [Actinomadura alba]